MEIKSEPNFLENIVKECIEQHKVLVARNDKLNQDMCWMQAKLKLVDEEIELLQVQVDRCHYNKKDFLERVRALEQQAQLLNSETVIRREKLGYKNIPSQLGIVEIEPWQPNLNSSGFHTNGRSQAQNLPWLNNNPRKLSNNDPNAHHPYGNSAAQTRVNENVENYDLKNEIGRQAFIKAIKSSQQLFIQAVEDGKIFELDLSLDEVCRFLKIYAKTDPEHQHVLYILLESQMDKKNIKELLLQEKRTVNFVSILRKYFEVALTEKYFSLYFGMILIHPNIDKEKYLTCLREFFVSHPDYHVNLESEEMKAVFQLHKERLLEEITECIKSRASSSQNKNEEIKLFFTDLLEFVENLTGSTLDVPRKAQQWLNSLGIQKSDANFHEQFVLSSLEKIDLINDEIVKGYIKPGKREATENVVAEYKR